MDDVGLHLARTGEGAKAKVGNALLAAMPRVLTTLSVVGVAAMVWVGGHIILVGLHDLAGALGWSALGLPYTWVHHAEEAVAGATGALGGVLGWLTNTVGSAVLGLVVGALVVAVLHVLPHRSGEKAAGEQAHA